MNPNTFNIPKIIETINKGLTLASKAIPAYQKLKPIFQNTSYLSNILNIMKTNDTKEETKEIKEVKTTKKVSNNLPTFFQ